MFDAPIEHSGLTGIIDIRFPPPPATTVAWVVPVGLLLLLLLAGVFLYRRWRLGDLFLLIRLHRQSRSGRVGRRQAAYHLASLLQKALQLPRLSAETPAPPGLQAQAGRWRDFSQRLADARYAPAMPDAAAMDALLRESRYWLRQWR